MLEPADFSRPWFIVQHPQDKALARHAGKRCFLHNYTGTPNELRSVMMVKMDDGELVSLDKITNTQDLTTTPVKPRIQLELIMSTDRKVISGFATVRPVFVCVDDDGELIDLLLDEDETKVVIAQTTATRYEAHWCVEIGGLYYGLTGIEPLELRKTLTS